MGDKTEISWADATWNPYVGCSKVSEGCGTGAGSCYAIGVCHRGLSDHHRGLTLVTDEGVDWNGEVHRAPDSIFYKPLRWKRPRRIFPTSLSDPFYERLTVEQIAEMFAVMVLARWHTFELLTKRSKRMCDVLSRADFWSRVHVLAMGIAEVHGVPPPDTVDMIVPRNVWVGVSMELVKYRFRAEHLRRTPAAVRWISAEPLMGPLDGLDLSGINWLVCGGQSGAGASRMDPQWALDLRDRCAAAGTAFHMKQTGTVLAREMGLKSTAGSDLDEWPAEFQIREYPTT